jgi:hypothetical protein
MSARRSSGSWRQWLGLCFLGGAANVMAQISLTEESVRWMRWRFTEVNTGIEMEGDREQRSVAGSQVNRDSLYVVPTVGLGLQGSIYHPNLLQFNLNGQNGVGWQENRVDVPGGGNRSDALYLLRYQMSASLLKEKPYAATAFAEQEHTVRDYDFFTRATVDQRNLGGSVGFSDGPMPVSVSFRQVDEQVSGQARPLSLNENILTFSTYHEHSPGNRTDLSYTFDDYSRQESDAYTQTGTQHSIALNDQKTFGRGNRMKLTSSLSYQQLNSLTTPIGSGNANDRFNRYFTDHEHLNWKHTGQLQSDYNYSYNLQDSGAILSDGQAASAGLRHQLYESLSTAFDVHGQLNSSSGAGTSLSTTRYGVGLNENYTKRLGGWGRLTLGYGGLLDRERRETLGLVQFVVGETHTLNDGVITFLDQPQVSVSSIQVSDASGAVLYRELLDYLVITHGERTEIKRTVGGQIPNGGTVRVDYSVVSQPSDSYTTFANQFQVRLDFFDGLLGLYGRLNLQDNYGGQSLVLEEITDQVAGLDFTWRWLRTGAEYEVYDSNLSPYRTARLFENFTLAASPDATLGLDVGQSWSTFPQSHRTLATYHAIARTRLRLSSALTVNLEGGMRRQDGEGYDQNLATARANLEFKAGKLAMRAGYAYENETFIEELRLRHYFFFRAKRTF